MRIKDFMQPKGLLASKTFSRAKAFSRAANRTISEGCYKAYLTSNGGGPDFFFTRL